MKGFIDVLLIEDNPTDAVLVQEHLFDRTITPFRLEHVDSLGKGLDRLSRGGIDVILLDLSLPDSEGMNTFDGVSGQTSEAAIVLLTGTDDRELALSIVRKGAQDYLVKGQIDGSILERSLRYAVERKRLELQQKTLIVQLQEALEKVRVLKGLVPICSSCKKIRNDKGFWESVEKYIMEHSSAEFTHGFCPECIEKAMEELEGM